MIAADPKHSPSLARSLRPAPESEKCDETMSHFGSAWLLANTTKG